MDPPTCGTSRPGRVPGYDFDAAQQYKHGFYSWVSVGMVRGHFVNVHHSVLHVTAGLFGAICILCCYPASHRITGPYHGPESPPPPAVKIRSQLPNIVRNTWKSLTQ